ncbi:hypothetical protein CRG98_007007 [Punica granatum]|uniref:Uncharacterized protein n=1 Tax=Punica granatum TaxID=22663 RepID=A0A2I0KWB2_PUNGR|nr:hypothetical protein CRG98_007007 [Punica granatum]
MRNRVELDPVEWVEEYNGNYYPPPQGKRRYQRRKKEFVGWGSRELIEFLESIGKDTSDQISKDDVAAIITGYINEHRLTDPNKKKKVNSDERLKSLFGRKSLRLNRVSNLLSKHYAENEESPDDVSSRSSGGEDIPAKRQQSISERKPLKKKVLKTFTSPFAAIIPDNLKLVYLKRSLVEDLLKDFENFEQKVIGSFVRVKSDPNDYLQKNPYQLLQVTGMRKVSEGADMSSVRLRVAVRDIRISMLSDDNFTKEECEELSQKIKDGVYKKLKMVDLEEKVQALHEDITKHWLVREISLLQNLIERANEKGWRKEYPSIKSFTS